MKKKWLYYVGCVVIPQIMLVIGIVFLSRQNEEIKKLGLELCKLSTFVLILGFLAYYVFFTPIFGLD